MLQRVISHGRDRSLPEVIVVQPKNPGIGSKAKFVRAMAPRQVVVDKQTGCASSLDPGVVESADRRESICPCALQHNRKSGKSLLKIQRPEEAPVPRKCRVKVIHQILRKDAGISRCDGVQRLRRDGVEQGIDRISVGSLYAGIGLKSNPGRVFLIDVVIDSSRLDLFVIVTRMRNAQTVRATIRHVAQWTPEYRHGRAGGISIKREHPYIERYRLR